MENFRKIAILYPYEYQKIFVSKFFPPVRSSSKSDMNYNLEKQTNLGVNESSIFTSIKLIDFGRWFLSQFQHKIWTKFTVETKKLFCPNDESFVHFRHLSFQALIYAIILIKIGRTEKKMQKKKTGTHARWKTAFFWNVFSGPVFYSLNGT